MIKNLFKLQDMINEFDEDGICLLYFNELK
jgi:hypothetical protein